MDGRCDEKDSLDGGVRQLLACGRIEGRHSLDTTSSAATVTRDDSSKWTYGGVLVNGSSSFHVRPKRTIPHGPHDPISITQGSA